MDLGIKGRVALVCASSKGLGRACATALAQAGCDVFINGRDSASLTATANAITEATDAKITAIIADVGTPAGRAALIAACPNPDILVNNNGGPTPRDFRTLTPEMLRAGIEANMLAPIALVQAYIDGMIARRFGRIINITSASVKMPLTGLDLSSGARAGLTAFLGGIAREVAAHNVTINHILPGAFETDRLVSSMERMAALRGTDVATLRTERQRNIPARRFGDPHEFGQACAFLASAHAGYITGQNLLIDGGAFPGAF